MLLTICVAVLVPFLLWSAFRLWRTARRLDRLHKRTEAAWSACAESLARRQVACRALIATGLVAGGEASALHHAIQRAEHASREQRAAAEQTLSQVLDAIPEHPRGDLAAELADAAARV